MKFDTVVKSLYSRTTKNCSSDCVDDFGQNNNKQQQVINILNLLGNPQNNLKIIHVAGTNGKTSTSFLIAKLIHEHGINCGLFTSPHLTKLTQRIRLNDREIPEEKFLKVYQNVIQIIEEYEEENSVKLTFFEIMFIIACQFFSNEGYEFAVIEAGIGGLNDVTNIIDPVISVITPISFDHQEILGDELQEIANHKAGIIKDGVPVIIASSSNPEIDLYLSSCANLKNSPQILENQDMFVQDSVISVGGQMATLETKRSVYQDIPIKLFGEYQAHNALIAICVCEELFYGYDEEVADDILVKAFQNIKIPGRFEKINKDPQIYFDTAHNPEAILKLTQTVSENFGNDYKIGIVAISKSKDYQTMIEYLTGEFDKIYFTGDLGKDNKLINPDILGNVAIEYLDTMAVTVEKSPENALNSAKSDVKNISEPAVIVICGSTFLAEYYLD